VVAHLSKLVRKSPLDIAAGTILRYPSLHDAGRDLFGAYDAFIGMLDDVEKRGRLEALRPEDATGDPLYREVHQIGTRFQRALFDIFFDQPGTPIPALTRRYGVF
jgi:hypothetical protein